MATCGASQAASRRANDTDPAIAASVSLVSRFVPTATVAAIVAASTDNDSPVAEAAARAAECASARPPTAAAATAPPPPKTSAAPRVTTRESSSIAASERVAGMEIGRSSSPADRYCSRPSPPSGVRPRRRRMQKCSLCGDHHCGVTEDEREPGRDLNIDVRVGRRGDRGHGPRRGGRPRVRRRATGDARRGRRAGTRPGRRTATDLMRVCDRTALGRPVRNHPRAPDDSGP